MIEKLAFAVVVSARKVRPYFDTHSVQILTNQPLEKALQKLETSGRLLKWAVELSKFDITFKPRTTIKAQALADFIVEAEYSETKGMDEEWVTWVDGSSA